jgi:hypothetical protein
MPTDEMPPLDGEIVETINKADLVPLNDSAHEHQYELDPDDKGDGYYAEICVLPNCHMGRLIAK